MEQLLVSGEKKLDGAVTVHGAKNSALPILAAAILVKGECIIHNCPRLSDVLEAINILKGLGCKAELEGNTAVVDASTISGYSIDEQTMRSMRSSIIFLGALVSRMGIAQVYYPGGCEIGTRPVDLHINSLRSMGVTVEEKGSAICCKADKIYGTKIILPFPSVGATENIIIASVMAKGRTTIINAAREPEISDLADFLNHCGARIYGAGEGTIEIEGVSSLHPAQHDVIPDRIVVSTYMAAAAITGSTVTVNNVVPTHVAPVFPAFNQMGCRIYLSASSLKLEAPHRLKRISTIKTMPYPGFPTDSQPIIAAVLCKAKGTSVIQENIFENRFRYISELKRFGTDIEVNDNLAVINGVKEFHAANVNATDLRGGAALVIASLAADGISRVNCVNYIDRGYENIEKSLSQIGADIKRITYEKQKDE